MRRILVIGIGAGNPDHLTVEAIEALNRADVIFVPEKGAEKSALAELRHAICRRFIRRPDYRTVPVALPKRAEAGDDYRGVVDDWHARIAQTYAHAFASEIPEGGRGAMLVWGDPALYDSTLRILERIRESGGELDWQVVPGISSVQVLAARHRIPLNTIGGPILITTGRRLGESFPADQDSVVVMLDGEQSFARLPDRDLDIWWGAYLGTPDEILVAGPLAEVSDEIARRRREARAAHGWIMDTYLLRRRPPG